MINETLMRSCSIFVGFGLELIIINRKKKKNLIVIITKMWDFFFLFLEVQNAIRKVQKVASGITLLQGIVDDFRFCE